MLQILCNLVEPFHGKHWKSFFFFEWGQEDEEEEEERTAGRGCVKLRLAQKLRCSPQETSYSILYYFLMFLLLLLLQVTNTKSTLVVPL